MAWSLQGSRGEVGMRNFKVWLVGFAAMLAASSAMGCVVVSDGDDGRPGVGGSGGTPPNPVGPVARTAEDAWPTVPDAVDSLDRERIVDACVTAIACAVSPEDPNRLLALDICVNQIEWSAERAIPMSGLVDRDERAEFYVSCVLEAVGDCNGVRACSTGRDPAIDCQEDGCRATSSAAPEVTCDGTVATLAMEGRVTDRDCSRAFAECDPISPTGCTDRLFTACPSDADRADRCDGDIRLGCDGAGQVSYHDCSRMGGRCGTTPEGNQGCIYSDQPDAGCTGTEPQAAACDGTMLSVCVNDIRVTVQAPELCPGV
jgi:hypothetical protein